MIVPARQADPVRHPRAADRSDRSITTLEIHGTGDRRDARHGAFDGVGHPHQDRNGQARTNWPGARGARRARPTGRADPHRRQETRAHRAWCRTPRHRPRSPATQREEARRCGRRPKLVGWQRVHIAIDDATRLAYAEVLPDEKATTAVGFLRRAIEFYARHGITVEQLITDNGSPYVSFADAAACRLLGILDLRTRRCRPQTNGKVECFIRTLSQAGPRTRPDARDRTHPRP